MRDTSEALRQEIEALEAELSIARQARDAAIWDYHQVQTSTAFRAGDALVQAFRKPGRQTLALLPRLLTEATRALKRRGRRPQGSPTAQRWRAVTQEALAGEGRTSTAPAGGLSTPPRGLLFFCVNGAGLGHLTRALAIARRIRRAKTDLPIYFLSSSHALPVIAQEGFPCYYIPPKSAFGESITTNAWNSLLLWLLQPILGIHGPLSLVYDGVFPYAGLSDAIANMQFVQASMILRLRHKKGLSADMLPRLKIFDELILPGEATGEPDPALKGFSCVPADPVIYLDRSELLSREEARGRLGIPADRKAVYLQLGAGNIDDTTGALRTSLDVCAQRGDTTVILAKSPISHASTDWVSSYANVQTLTQYPNSLYFNAFDLAVSAAGYNTFHELMHFGVPSVLVPNQQTATDDQVGRALTAQDAGAARVALSTQEIPSAMDWVLAQAHSTDLRTRAAALVPKNGAVAIARHILAVNGLPMDDDATLCATQQHASGRRP